jgi:hypothetical protein
MHFFFLNVRKKNHNLQHSYTIVFLNQCKRKRGEERKGNKRETKKGKDNKRKDVGSQAPCDNNIRRQREKLML